MNSLPLKAFVFVFFMCLATLPGTAKSFAQDNDSSNDQAQEDQTQKALDQIHALELKMQDNAKHLDALEKAIDQTHTGMPADETASINTADTNSTAQENQENVFPAQETPVEQAPAQAAPPVQEPPAQEATPVQAVSTNTSPQEESIAEIKAEPVDVLPQAHVYYAPAVTTFTKEHTFELSEEDFYSTFKEIGDYEVYKKSGVFFGLNAGYTYQPLEAENWLLNVYHIDVHGDYGLVDYNYEGEKVNSINNYMVEPRTWLGKDFDFGSTSLTPYVGVGYRWYYDQLKNNTDDAGDGGFNIQTQYVYIPVGALFSVRPTEGWRVTLNGEYDFLVWGRINNYLSEYSPAVSNLSNTLKGGYGLRGSVKIVKEGYLFNYFIEPYIRYWQINNSKTSEIQAFGAPFAPYQEDRNHTTEVGARLGVEF